MIIINLLTHMMNKDTFDAAKLIKIRKQHGLTQEDMADMCELSTKTYANIECGRHVKYTTYLAVIATLIHDLKMKVSPDDFIIKN